MIMLLVLTSLWIPPRHARTQTRRSLQTHPCAHKENPTSLVCFARATVHRSIDRSMRHPSVRLTAFFGSIDHFFLVVFFFFGAAFFFFGATFFFGAFFGLGSAFRLPSLYEALTLTSLPSSTNFLRSLLKVLPKFSGKS